VKLVAVLFLAFRCIAAEKTPEIVWEKEFPENIHRTISAGGGAVFAATLDGVLYAFKIEDGAPLWQAKVPGGVQAGPVYVNGRVVMVDSSRRMPAFDAKSGEPVWVARLKRSATSDIGAADDVVCVGEGRQALSAFNLSDGTQIWRAASVGNVAGAPWVGDAEIVFGTTGHKLYVLDKTSGQPVKEMVLTGEVNGRASGVPPGARKPMVVVGTHDGKLYGLTTAWAHKWTAKTIGESVAAPLVLADIVCAGTDKGLLYSIDKDFGGVAWKRGLGGPVVDQIRLLGTVIVAGAGKTLNFVDLRDGSLLKGILLEGTVLGVAESESLVATATSARKLYVAAIAAAARNRKKPEQLDAIVSVSVEPGSINLKKEECVLVTFSLRKASSLTVDVAGVDGRRIKLISNREKAKTGSYRLSWNGRDEGGKKVSPGVFRIRIVAGTEQKNVGVDVVEGR